MQGIASETPDRLFSLDLALSVLKISGNFYDGHHPHIDSRLLTSRSCRSHSVGDVMRYTYNRQNQQRLRLAWTGAAPVSIGVKNGVWVRFVTYYSFANFYLIGWNSEGWLPRNLFSVKKKNTVTTVGVSVNATELWWLTSWVVILARCNCCSCTSFYFHYCYEKLWK